MAIAGVLTPVEVVADFGVGLLVAGRVVFALEFGEPVVGGAAVEVRTADDDAVEVTPVDVAAAQLDGRA